MTDDYESPYAGLPTTDDAESWTLEECSEYVALSWEMHGELSAEAGMGAMSLGYGQDGAYEAANAVSQPADDPKFVIANRRLEEERKRLEANRLKMRPTHPRCADDIPF